MAEVFEIACTHQSTNVVCVHVLSGAVPIVDDETGDALCESCLSSVGNETVRSEDLQGTCRNCIRRVLAQNGWLGN